MVRNNGLRPYQVEAVGAFAEAQSRRDKLHVISLPTGSGKTRVGVELALRHLADGSRARVLWLAPRWPLVGQASDAFEEACPDAALCRIGGAGRIPLMEDDYGVVCFTTLSTWYHRHKRRILPRAAKPSKNLLAVVDEPHWALNSTMGRAFLRAYLRRGPTLGLTATPKEHEGGAVDVIYQKTYGDLAGKYLPYFKVKEVKTGEVWDPVIRNHLISEQSLHDLGDRSDRNKLIVNEVRNGLRTSQFSRPLVFACNIAHANELFRLFGERGVPARVIHSQIDNPRKRDATLQEFRDGKVSVLINVVMCAMGIDIPEIDAVILTRPTASSTLCSQMIGRAARGIKGKHVAWIIEFTDNIGRLGDQVFHARGLLADAQPRRRRRATSAARQHNEPLDVPRFENLPIWGLRGISFAQGQTFGVEIELTSPTGVPEPDNKWDAVGRRILDCLRKHANRPVAAQPLGYGEHDGRDEWHVEYDSSAGWEVISPVLVGAEGFQELQAVCRGLKRLVDSSRHLLVNYRTGLHITLATRLNTDDRLRGFLRQLQRLEPGLFSLVAPSRYYLFDGGRYYLDRRNPYCSPIRETVRAVNRINLTRFSDQSNNRFRSVNLAHAHDDIEKLEVRMHSGTVDYRKIIPWICLWMHVFNRARYEWAGPGVVGEVFEGHDQRIGRHFVDREDLFKLLEQEGICLSKRFETLLRRRRRALRDAWSAVLPRRVRAWERAGWYD
jgi:superfamily II DNA or RNA helicase